MEIPPDPHIDADRLCQAAEAALAAAAQIWEQPGGRWPYPADLMGRPDQPECLRGFTRWEMERASEFLVRLGWIERPERQRQCGPGNPSQPAAHGGASHRGQAPR
jgi:hypothetical protein